MSAEFAESDLVFRTCDRAVNRGVGWLLTCFPQARAGRDERTSTRFTERTAAEHPGRLAAVRGWRNMYPMKPCLSLCILAGALCAAAFADDFEPTTLSLGSPAPDFKLPGVDGHNYTLARFG